MEVTNENNHRDFEQAMGEEFAEAVSPPVPFDAASAHECCEVVWAVVGFEVTPSILAALTEGQITMLGQKFGEYFDCSNPDEASIKAAISRTLRRWPVGSVGDTSSD